MKYGYYIENISEKVYRDNSPLFRCIRHYKIHEDYVYVDREDDKSEFEKLTSITKSGDTVFIRSLQDIANNTGDVFKKIKFFYDNNIELCSIGEPYLLKEYYEDFINFILDTNIYYREFSRELNHRRAKEAGSVGRPQNDKIKAAIKLFEGGMRATEVIQTMNIPERTFFRALKEHKLAKI